MPENEHTHAHPHAHPHAGAPGPLVLGLGGSTRAESRTLTALRVALEGAERAGARTRLLSIAELGLPILQPDLTVDQVPAAKTLVDAAREADALILASPLYQETISGALKNALDYLGVLETADPPGLTGRVVGLLSVAGGKAVVGASLAMRAACDGMGAWVLPESIDLDGTSFDADNRLCNLLARDELRALGRAVTSAALTEARAHRHDHSVLAGHHHH